MNEQVKVAKRRQSSTLGAFPAWRRAILLLLAPLLWPSSVQASPSYGYYLIQYFQFAPGCQGCHETGLGGAGTVVQPFGRKMMELGLMGNNNYALLIETLQKLGDSDSDGDGALDVDEVTKQGDPNDPSIFPVGFVPPDEGAAGFGGQAGSGAVGGAGAESAGVGGAAGSATPLAGEPEMDDGGGACGASGKRGQRSSGVLIACGLIGLMWGRHRQG